MKIRNGFISNSSSSSFLIDNWDNELTAEKVKEDVVKMIKKWRDKEVQKRYSYMTEENSTVWHDRVQSWWSDENIEKCVFVEEKKAYSGDFSENTMKNINYWYSPCDISQSSIVIYDETDNFIPEEVCDKIIKKYKKQDKLINCCTHMG